jgi:alkanesulfonate monooxygenase SsuD/methylene tetrahydromethanopterin reductase-like flavin-dependent oxidoreductase (luciferase family)
VKFGVFGMNMRPRTAPEAAAKVARAAEAAGFESLWGEEHIVPADPQAGRELIGQE